MEHPLYSNRLIVKVLVVVLNAHLEINPIGTKEPVVAMSPNLNGAKKQSRKSA
jgi:hypothetical protein